MGQTVLPGSAIPRVSGGTEFRRNEPGFYSYPHLNLSKISCLKLSKRKECCLRQFLVESAIDRY